jgi:hypothetical protein
MIDDRADVVDCAKLLCDVLLSPSTLALSVHYLLTWHDRCVEWHASFNIAMHDDNDDDDDDDDDDDQHQRTDIAFNYEAKRGVYQVERRLPTHLDWDAVGWLVCIDVVRRSRHWPRAVLLPRALLRAALPVAGAVLRSATDHAVNTVSIENGRMADGADPGDVPPMSAAARHSARLAFGFINDICQTHIASRSISAAGTEPINAIDALIRSCSTTTALFDAIHVRSIDSEMLDENDSTSLWLRILRFIRVTIYVCLSGLVFLR